MRKNIFAISIILASVMTGAIASELDNAISVVRAACSDISDEMADMKRMAGINTAVTGVGTVAGGVALGTGIAKANLDKKSAELNAAIAELESMGAKRIDNADEFIELYSQFLIQSGDVDNVAMAAALKSQHAKLTARSKNLGNWRTGTLALNTATNVAGAVIAGGNRVRGDLQSSIDECVTAVKTLSFELGQARVSGQATDAEIAYAQKIVSECGKWETVNLTDINKRAQGATLASGIGAGVGFAGTIVSAVANTDKTRHGDAQKEKNLNTAANVMAGGATAASATATVFNATQISAIKRAATVADGCEGALK